MAIRSNGPTPPTSRPPAGQVQRTPSKGARSVGDQKGGAARVGKDGKAKSADGVTLDKGAFRDGLERTDRDRQRTTTGTFVAVGEKANGLDAAASKARAPSGDLRRAAHPDGKVGKKPKADGKAEAKPTNKSSAKGTGVKAEAKGEGKVAAKGIEAKGDGKVEAKGVEAKGDGKVDAKAVAAKGEGKVEAKGVEAKGVEAKGDAKPGVKTDAKPGAKGDAKLDAKVDGKADAKADAKADVKAEGKLEGKAEGKAEAKPADGAKPAGDGATAKAKPEAAAEKPAAGADKAGVDTSPDGAVPNAAAMQAAASRGVVNATPQKTSGASSSGEAKGSSGAAKGEGASSSSASGGAGAAGGAKGAAAGGGAHGAKIDGPQAKRQVEGALVSDRPASGAQAAPAKPSLTSSSGNGLQRSANAPAPPTTDAKLAALTKGASRAEIADAAKGLEGGALDEDLAAAAVAQRESDIADALSAGTEVAHASRRVAADAEAFAEIAAQVREDADAIDGVLLDDEGREAAAAGGLPFVKKDDHAGVDFPVITADMKLMATILANQRMDASDIVSDLETRMSESDSEGGGDEGGGDEGGEE